MPSVNDAVLRNLICTGNYEAHFHWIKVEGDIVTCDFTLFDRQPDNSRKYIGKQRITVDQPTDITSTKNAVKTKMENINSSASLGYVLPDELELTIDEIAGL